MPENKIFAGGCFYIISAERFIISYFFLPNLLNIYRLQTGIRARISLLYYGYNLAADRELNIFSSTLCTFPAPLKHRMFRCQNAFSPCLFIQLTSFKSLHNDVVTHEKIKTACPCPCEWPKTSCKFPAYWSVCSIGGSFISAAPFCRCRDEQRLGRPLRSVTVAIMMYIIGVIIVGLEKKEDNFCVRVAVVDLCGLHIMNKYTVIQCVQFDDSGNTMTRMGDCLTMKALFRSCKHD